MTSRFRTLTPDSEGRSEDKILIDLDRFEAELAATIAKFDARLPAEILPPGNGPEDSIRHSPEYAAPQTLDPVAPIVTAPAPANPFAFPEPALPVAAPSGLDLLSELRQVAEQKVARDLSAEEELKEKVERTNLAMRRLFRYLAEFASHLNKIQPALPHSFRSPLPGIDLTSMRWLDSFIDYRTDGGTETSPLDSISMRYSLSSGKTVRIDKLPNHASAFQEELKRYGFRFQAHERRGTKGMIEEVEFRIDPAVTIFLSFKAQAASETIHVKTRHLTTYPEFGFTEYLLQVAEVDQALLDEFGKYILGRPSHLLQQLKKLKVT